MRSALTMSGSVRGIIAYLLAFGVLPLALWLNAAWGTLDFGSFYGFMSSIGRPFGILALCFFAGNLVLAARYRFVDRLFGGLDKAYSFHHETGVDVFTFATIHFASIALREYGGSFLDVIRYVFDFGIGAALWGKVAYIILVSLIALAIYFSRKVRYERHKFLHAFMGVGFAFAAYHAITIGSDVSANSALRAYVLAIAALGLGSFLWRVALRRRLWRPRPFEVVEVAPAGGGVTEIAMKPSDGRRLEFSPGQFMFVSFRQYGFPMEEHPFTIASSARDRYARISVKNLGDYTGNLGALKPGAKADVFAPYGGFGIFRTGNKRQIWVAGGIGITPFLSMARTFKDDARAGKLNDYRIALVHSGRTADDLVYRNELEQFGLSHDNFRYVPWVTEERGYVTAEAIRKLLDDSNELCDVASCDVFICGPMQMMQAVAAQFAELGVPASNIHYEEFRLL